MKPRRRPRHNYEPARTLRNDEKIADFVTFTFDEIKKSAIITDTLLPTVMQVLIANLEQDETIVDLGIDFEELKKVNWKENLEYMEAQHFYPSNRFLCPFYLKKVLTEDTFFSQC